MEQSRLPLVYKLTNNGIESTLVGTIHLAPDTFQDDVKRYMQDKETLYLETDPSNMSASGKEAFGLTLTAKEEAAVVRELMGDTTPELLPDLVDMIRTARRQRNQKLFGTPYAKAVDATMYELARERGLKIQALEDESQIKNWQTVMYGIDGLADKEFIDRYNRTIVHAYLTGDLQSLEHLKGRLDTYHKELLNTISPNGHAAYDALCIERNQNMAEVIAAIEKPALIGVGIGHLLGDDSLLEILRKRIEIERIQPK